MTTTQKRGKQEIMVSTGSFIERVVHTTRKHPQVGTICYEGQKRKVFISFYLDEPVWKLVEDQGDEEEYVYCAQKTMPIEDDPEYCGEENEEAAARTPADLPVVIIQQIVTTGARIP
jgi:hypothetical protein